MKSVAQISREMFNFFKELCYHLKIEKDEIKHLINKNERSD